MFQVFIFIPLADNDGNPFAAIDFDSFEREIVARFGGFSVLPGAIVGAWKDDAGREYRDFSRCYMIAIVSIVHGTRIYELALFAKALFVQEAIAIAYLGHFEVIS
jgi:hypothetical protein